MNSQKEIEMPLLNLEVYMPTSFHQKTKIDRYLNIYF